MQEYRPWEGDDISKLTNTRKTKDIDQGIDALRAVREKMGGVLKKDQALKVGMYTPPRIKRKEGETWVDADGKKWEMKNGIAQAISKVQDAKRPWFCPECQKIMKGKADDRMWILRGKCHGCVVAEETQMRINGTWEYYERSLMIANAIALVKDRIDEYTDWREMVGNPQIHFMDGTYEEWNINSDQLKDDLTEEIDYLNEQLLSLEKQKQLLDEKL